MLLELVYVPKTKKGMSFAILAIVIIAVLVASVAFLIVAGQMGFLDSVGLDLTNLLTIETP